MSMGDLVIQTVISLIESVVQVIVRSFGFFPGAKVKKLELIVGWLIILIFVAGLLYLTIKYS